MHIDAAQSLESLVSKSDAFLEGSEICF